MLPQQQHVRQSNTSEGIDKKYLPHHFACKNFTNDKKDHLQIQQKMLNSDDKVLTQRILVPRLAIIVPDFHCPQLL